MIPVCEGVQGVLALLNVGQHGGIAENRDSGLEVNHYPPWVDSGCVWGLCNHVFKQSEGGTACRL